jgi:ATP-dependent DNA ligase
MTQQNFREPMLCQSILPDNLAGFQNTGEWFCQDKIDGCRAIVYIANGKITAIQGRRNWITHRYPDLTALEFANGINAVIDCEIVCIDNDFNHLQSREQNNKSFKIDIVSAAFPVKLMCFDILEFDGQDMTALPIEHRLDFQKCIFGNDKIFMLPIYTDLSVRFELVKKEQREGIIVKKFGSRYNYGKRSADWQKCKFFKEVVVCFDRYEVNNAGICVENANGTRVQVSGQQSIAVKNAIDRNGSANLEIQYLEMTKAGCYRMPSFKGLVVGGI